MAAQVFEKTVREQVASHGPGPAGTTAGIDPIQARIAFMEQRFAGMQAIIDRLMIGPHG